jgi:hypothetical protein
MAKPLRDIAGLSIGWLHVGSEDPVWVGVTAPDNTKILTFDIGDWLVLDPYGDGSIPSTIRARIFGDPDGESRLYTLAAHRTTGVLAFASYFIEKLPESDLPYTPGIMRAPRHSIAISGLMPSFTIPPEYVARLDELRSKKRPYDASFDPTALMDFIDRESGYGELHAAMVFTFNFDGEFLQVTDACHRSVSGWVHRDLP